uniref:ParB/RepB/Spo0J family partition protein n=1 Tax=Agathobacter sp. TaxID=2021311 RepID=UPI004056C342
MAKLSGFTKEDSSRVKTAAPPLERIKLIHYSKLVTGRYQYRDRGKTTEQLREEIMDMAVWIELAGGVLEPVLVRKTDVDRYEIIAGHTRTGGCRYLVEEQGKAEYAFVPCIVKPMSDEDAEANTSFSNARKPATQVEILHEIEIAKKRLEKHPNPELKGRFVERFAKKHNMAPSVVGDYINISRNLGEECKKAFENGEIKKSAAVALAALPEREQNELLHAGVTSHKAIKQYKSEKDAHNNAGEESQNPESGQGCINKPENLHRTEKGTAYRQQDESPLTACSICGSLAPSKGTFRFEGKSYCGGCLYDLLMALGKAGKISIDAEGRGYEGWTIT